MTDLAARPQHVLRHPLTDPASQDITAYRTTEEQRDGNLLVAILAVDR